MRTLIEGGHRGEMLEYVSVWGNKKRKELGVIYLQSATKAESLSLSVTGRMDLRFRDS